MRGAIVAELDCKLALLPFPGKVRSDDPTLTPAALAAKSRALMTENDPDAIRAGLAELADALEQMD